MIITDTMTVTINTQSSNRISFAITTPVSPLFLGTLVVDGLPPGGNGVIGTLSPVGLNLQNTSVHNFHLGSTRIQQFLAAVNANPGPPLSIQITYDNVTLAASDVSVPPMRQMVANG